MFNCSFRFYLFVSFSCFVCHIMPESIANLKRENIAILIITEEISRLKDLIQQQSSSAAYSAEETAEETW